jgi:hypothetical protein
MPCTMSKLFGQFVLLSNPPQTEAQEAYAKRLGFRKRRSGDWVAPEVLVQTGRDRG